MSAQAQTQLRFVSYNCENLFDCRHDTMKNDQEFLPEAERHWTFGRYWRKLNDIGRVIHECGSQSIAPSSYTNGSPAPESDDLVSGGVSTRDSDWHLPDLVTLVEVENDSVLFMLTRRTMLKGAGYRYVMTDSPDPRGVDVALLYNPLTFRLTDHHAIRITPPKGNHATRDVLYVKGCFRGKDTLHIFCVHAPSRAGGQKETERYRLTVAQRICQSIDSIRSLVPDANIIVAGDFNDYSRDKSLRYISCHGIVETSPRALPQGDGAIGTYKYQGQWDSLDHIFLSPSLHQRLSTCHILHNKWMTEEDAQGGFKPRRTFLGPIYHGGVSDHLPLIITLEF